MAIVQVAGLVDSDVIRLARPEDGAAFAAIYAPFVESTIVTFEEVAPTASEMAERVGTILQTLPWLAVEVEGEAVGFAYASPHRARAGYRWAVDTAVYLASGHLGKGHGRALYEALLPILVAQGYVTAYAGIALPNEGSVRLHESMGFEPVGVYRNVGFKAGRWVDVGWWGRPLGVREVPPEEPVPFAELGW